MSYTVQECIVDMLAASGPQDYRSLAIECRTQAIEPRTRETMTAALTSLTVAGIIYPSDYDEEIDEWVYDFTDYGYSLVLDWSAHGNARQSAALDAKWAWSDPSN